MYVQCNKKITSWGWKKKLKSWSQIYLLITIYWLWKILRSSLQCPRQCVFSRCKFIVWCWWSTGAHMYNGIIAWVWIALVVFVIFLQWFYSNLYNFLIPRNDYIRRFLDWLINEWSESSKGTDNIYCEIYANMEIALIWCETRSCFFFWIMVFKNCNWKVEKIMILK